MISYLSLILIILKFSYFVVNFQTIYFLRDKFIWESLALAMGGSIHKSDGEL